MTLTTRRPYRVAGELRHVDKWYGNHHVLATSRCGWTGEIVALIGAAGPASRPCCACWPGCRRTTPASDCRRRARIGFSGAAVVSVARRRTNVGYGLTRSRLPRAEVHPGRPGAGRRGSRRPCRRVAADAVRWSGATGFAGSRACRRARLLLLDEPFGALDALTRLTMRALLLDLWRGHGFGVLLVTHASTRPLRWPTALLVLEEGAVVHT